MNITKFVVLGTLDHLSPASGYDIIRDLDKKMISRWTNVKKGVDDSTLHAFIQKKNGLDLFRPSLFTQPGNSRKCYLWLSE